jgi:hypothetical protein
MRRCVVLVHAGRERNTPLRRVSMVWFIVIIALVVITVAFFEWRSWNKPQSRDLQDGDPYRFRGSGRPLTGGNDFDQRHD